MKKENTVNKPTKAMPYDALLSGVIVIFTHNLMTAKLDSFFWLDQYGWCFDWYENEEEEEADCKTYGLFPKDYIDQNGDFEKNITDFLKSQPKINAKDIPVSKFFEWINAT